MKFESKYDRAVEDPEGERLAREAAEELLLVEISTAHALERMTKGCAFVYAGASSVVHFAGLLGIAKRKAQMLSAAGRAFRLMPILEQKVREREMAIESAAALAKILEHPVLSRDAWEWLGRAADRTAGQLAFLIQKAIAEEDAKSVVEPVTLMLKPEVRDKMGRIREIVSRKVGEAVTNEQVVEFTFDYFLENEDPDRVPAGTRRKGPTVKDPSRAIPRSVRQKVLERGRKCQVHGCSNHLFLSFAHIEWHASGGSREAGNLLILCFVHHWALDHGLMRFSGTAESPVFCNSRGEVIGAARGPPGE
jgi:hypothetical protein